MPNRIIKESICTSEEIEMLSPFQETVFYRLIVNCDDYGRMDARAKILKSKLFPLRDVRVDQIESALDALASAELVILYEVDGKPFLQMKTWDRHQRMRAKVSKYPSPADSCGHVTAGRGHMTADDSEMPQDADIRARNPIQSESNPNPIRRGSAPARVDDPPANDSGDEDDGFDTFWKAFPRKSGDLREAYFAYTEALRGGATLAEMLEALEWQTVVWAADDPSGRYIPSPRKWLENQQWTEKRREPKKKTTMTAAEYAAAGPGKVDMDALQALAKRVGAID